MKKLILSLSIIIAAVSLVACSKDKGNSGNVGYPGQNGVYGSTPNDQHCGGVYPSQGYPNQGYPHAGYGHQGYRPNCPPQGMYGGNPYMHQMYLGSCDMRFAGRGPLCPPGYSCRTTYGPLGVCARY